MYFQGQYGNLAYNFPACYSSCFPTSFYRRFLKAKSGEAAQYLWIDSTTLMFKYVELLKPFLPPSTKLVMCIRNPVDAYVSFVKMMVRILPVIKATGKSRSKDFRIGEETFAESVDRAITHFEKYAKHMENELERQWNKGENWWMEFAGAIYWYCYVDHLEKLEKAFGKGSVHLVHQEDMISKPKETIVALLDYLEIDCVDNDSRVQRIVNTLNEEGKLAKISQGAATRSDFEIDDKSLDRLRKFFHPYNKRLAEFTGNERYLKWNETNVMVAG